MSNQFSADAFQLKQKNNQLRHILEEKDSGLEEKECHNKNLQSQVIDMQHHIDMLKVDLGRGRVPPPL